MLCAQVRKTAEKLLLRKLKAHLLEEEKAARVAAKAGKAAAAAQKKADREAGKASKPTRKRKRKEDAATAPVDDITASTQGGKNKSDESSKQLPLLADVNAPGTLQLGTARDHTDGSQAAGTSAAMLQQAHEAEVQLSEEVAAAAQAAEIAAAAEALEDDVEVEVADHDDGSGEDSDGELDLDAIISAGGEVPSVTGL